MRVVVGGAGEGRGVIKAKKTEEKRENLIPDPPAPEHGCMYNAAENKKSDSTTVFTLNVRLFAIQREKNLVS